MWFRKASASVLAVDERQSLETLTRDEKTSGRTLAQLKDKLEQLTQKRDKLAEDEQTHTAKKQEVRTCDTALQGVLVLNPIAQLDDKVASLAADLKRVKQEYDNQQSERMRIE